MDTLLNELNDLWVQALQGGWMWMTACLLMLPFNLLSESMRWRELLRGTLTATDNTKEISVAESLREILCGIAGGTLTPWRLGELPTRAWSCTRRTDIPWRGALEAGVVGSILMTAIIVLTGIVPLYLWFGQWLPQVLRKVLAGVAICVAAVVLWQQIVGLSWKGLHIVRWTRVIIWTLCRYACFGIQWWLMLRGVGIMLQPEESAQAIASYLLLVTVTPTIPVADMPIRAVWATAVLSQFTDTCAPAAIAATGIWLINTIVPMLFGLAVRK